MKKITLFLILIIGLASCLKDKDLTVKEDETTSSASPIIINEVYSTGEPDWVELYNTSDNEVDISGFKIADGPEAIYTLPAGTTVPAKGYLVIEVDKDILGFSLSSNGEEFYIWDTKDNLVDKIVFPTLNEGVSYGRVSTSGDIWEIMAASKGTANSTEGVVTIKINEIYSTGEPDWVELYNYSDESVDISGFQICDSDAADATKYTLPASTIVPAKGYLVLYIDKTVLGFSLSSKGEDFYIWDKEGNLIDNIEFPALEEGLSFGRSSDGAETWETMNPTKGAANSNVNSAPSIEADEIPSMTDNQGYIYSIIASDASGMRNVKLFFENKTTGQVKFEDMAPVGDNEYKYNFPVFNEDDEIEYYVVATDETGKKAYFPEDAPDDKLSVTVGSDPIFRNFSMSSAVETADTEISIDVFDKDGINTGGTDVRLYYTINSENPDDKVRVDMTYTSGANTEWQTWTATIPGQVEGVVIRYYIRAEDDNGNKGYYPLEDDNFDHDIGSSWPSVTVQAVDILNQLVINEVCPRDRDNTPYYVDGQGEGADWVELYNATSASIDIAGYWITDKGSGGSGGDLYEIPTGDAITIIPAGGRITLIFGAEDVAGDDMEGIIDDGGKKIFIPIGINGSDEAVALFSTNGTTLIDVAPSGDDMSPAYDDEKSIGRMEDAASIWKVFEEVDTTPNASNQ